ncbi:hypothetical protein B0A50_00340 [Salinomyces thailandicus]|uniref:XPG-I domain-containing protein n=1 Tax=Salinomyces thailandicus TaxID=706561 RepID=A0A4U0UFM8_9PEZI|nr:hypothetical protein B0A50_00340 [Salinomyces thailandica]
MGIHGLLKELLPAPRTSLAALSATHYTTTGRPLRLAIDISIWLFQIQCGKGGSNPALRTFYYRLLRLLTLNIHPLFVFDGPNKPLFKRHKKVGGPGVRVVSVPEFLAKQLLKQFGFPWHVAPGEAEAECAWLQREGVVDAVLSEDVDTLMFGSGMTLRTWTAERSGSGGGSGNGAPTHVSVYRRAETTARSRGIEPEGMILVALMSGGDYLPEGIPGCGVKVACDAARAGFGKDLCGLGLRDREGLEAWRARLQHEIRANESKHFSRRNPSFTMPDDFPNQEVLGYYTHPFVSSPEKLERLRSTLRWDQQIDLPALRDFARDAFDWRCVTGAKKFIKNLAPAMLVRQLRLSGEREEELDPAEQAAAEASLAQAVHGKRNHVSVDGELEYRISFTPADLVPIDLSLEDEDDEDFRGGSQAEEEELPSDAESECPSLTPASPSKKRIFKPYDPATAEKVWVLRPFLQIGCPLLVEEYEASLRDPKAFLQQRRKAKAAGSTAKTDAGAKTKKGNDKARKKKEGGGMPQDALMAYTRTTKAGTSQARKPLGEGGSRGNSQNRTETAEEDESGDQHLKTNPGGKGFANAAPTLCSSDSSAAQPPQDPEIEILDLQTTPPTTRHAPALLQAKDPPTHKPTQQPHPQTRKRRSPSPSSPFSTPRSQRTITAYYTPSPRKAIAEAIRAADRIDLLSSSPVKEGRRSVSPSPGNLRRRFVRSPEPLMVSQTAVGGGLTGVDVGAGPRERRGDGRGEEEEEEEKEVWDELPSTVTKRRRRGKRVCTAAAATSREKQVEEEQWKQGEEVVETIDLTSPSPPPSASIPFPLPQARRGGLEADPTAPTTRHATKAPPLFTQAPKPQLSLNVSIAGPPLASKTSYDQPQARQNPPLRPPLPSPAGQTTTALPSPPKPLQTKKLSFFAKASKEAGAKSRILIPST